MTAPVDFSVDEREEEGVRVLAVAGELDIATAPSLCARLDASRAARQPRLVVDLSGVEFCDSTGLRALLGAASEVHTHGGRFALVCRPEGNVARLLDIVGASELIAIHPDRDAALSAVAPA
jgi:anti-sigma B factor antagonist